MALKKKGRGHVTQELGLLLFFLLLFSFDAIGMPLFQYSHANVDVSFID